jgi:hypothetical protein
MWNHRLTLLLLFHYQKVSREFDGWLSKEGIFGRLRHSEQQFWNAIFHRRFTEMK